MLRGYYRVLQAADAATALQMAQSARPDLVVTDVNMPHIGGYELAIALREASGPAGPVRLGICRY